MPCKTTDCEIDYYYNLSMEKVSAETLQALCECLQKLEAHGMLRNVINSETLRWYEKHRARELEEHEQ